MAAIMNGIALHGGFIPYGGTFLTFSDYSRNAIRMAALMKQRVDPRLHARLDRPRRGRADAPVDRARGVAAPDPEPRRLAAVRHASRRAVAWAAAIEQPRAADARCCCRARTCRTRPSRLDAAARGALGEIAKGAYVLAEPAEVGLQRKPQAVIIATGSEVQLALQAQQQLAQPRRRHRGARRLDAVDDRLRPPGRGLQASRCCRPACRASRSRPASPTAGGSTAAPRSSASTASANRRRRRCCSSTSASRPRTSSPRCRLRCAR